MSSTIINKKKQNSKEWRYLPKEILLIVFDNLRQDGCKLSPLAAVCREWQEVVERETFSRIKLTASRLADFSRMTRRNRALVRYIWLCLELHDYECAVCAINSQWEESCAVSDTGPCPIVAVFQILFFNLSDWGPASNLTLDITAFSAIDSQRWFPHQAILPDAPSGRLAEQHGAEHKMTQGGHRPCQLHAQNTPIASAYRRSFRTLMKNRSDHGDGLQDHWWGQLPDVPAVTSVLLRLQTRLRWKPDALARMFARFPRLEEIQYEPWRDFVYARDQANHQRGYMFESLERSNSNLKRLVLFENCNERLPDLVWDLEDDDSYWTETRVQLEQPKRLQRSRSTFHRKMVLASRTLEHLAVSFMVDANHFFEIQPTWKWENLRSLALTSKLLAPETKPTEVSSMLVAAAKAAMKMPRLEAMELWNGRNGLAALFRFQAVQRPPMATITWRGSWALTMEPDVIKAWEAVVRNPVVWVQEEVDGSAIKSYADAIVHLQLSCQIIRSVSLEQIRIEDEALEKVRIARFGAWLTPRLP